MINPFMFNSFVQGTWVSSSDPVNATIGESGRLFTSITSGSSMPAYVNSAKTTGKWFFAVELVSFCNNTFVYAVGVDTAVTPLTTARGLGGQPNTAEYCYGKFLGAKKWVAGTPSAYGTLSSPTDFVGISYDAGNGEVRGYRWVSGAWTDDGVITTLTAGTSCKPYVQCTGGSVTQSSVRLTSNKAAPSGFTLWA